jgi:hypothetical protein
MTSAQKVNQNYQNGAVSFQLTDEEREKGVCDHDLVYLLIPSECGLH